MTYERVLYAIGAVIIAIGLMMALNEEFQLWQPQLHSTPAERLALLAAGLALCRTAKI